MASVQSGLSDAGVLLGASDVTPRLSVRGVGLTLGGRVVLDDVSFSVSPGEVFGLLGPNGSGKTSLMRCLTGLMRPDLGVIWLNGNELGPKDRKRRADIGVVFQDASLDDRLTALENLRLSAALFGIRGKEATRRAKDLLVFMELADRANDLVKTLSGGMRRRLEIARALIHSPKLLLMDEPTTGLDVSACERLWQRLLALRKLQGITLVLTTHKPEEAALCDRLLVVDRGHVVIVDTPDALLSRVSGDVITLDVADPEALVTELRDVHGLHAEVVDGAVVFEREAAHTFVPRLVESQPAGRLRSVGMRRPTLADAFLKITGRRLGGQP
jgi:ABC-2 type transport system ATP-binding protein